MNNETQPHSPWEFELAYDEHNRLVIRRPVQNPVSHMTSYVWGPWEPVRELCEHELIYGYSFKPSGLPGMPYATVAVKCRKCGKTIPQFQEGV